MWCLYLAFKIHQPGNGRVNMVGHPFHMGKWSHWKYFSNAMDPFIFLIQDGLFLQFINDLPWFCPFYHRSYADDFECWYAVIIVIFKWKHRLILSFSLVLIVDTHAHTCCHEHGTRTHMHTHVISRGHVSLWLPVFMQNHYVISTTRCDFVPIQLLVANIPCGLISRMYVNY